MAYKNLVNESLSGASGNLREADLFMRVRDFVCARNATYDYSSTGIGWTLEDSSYAVDEDNAAVNDWYVVSSSGEGGDEQLYYHLKLIDNYIQIHGWQYWSSLSQAGSGVHWYRDQAMQIGDAPEILYIYGDLDFVHLAAKGVAGNTNWYMGGFGCLETDWLIPYEGVARNIQVCATTLTAGSDVSIVVPDSTSSMWASGNKLMIMDESNMEMITVKTNDDATTITADLVNSYTTNAKLAVHFPYFVSGGNTTQHFYSGYAAMMHGMDGDTTGGLTNTATIVSLVGTSLFSYQDPGWNGMYMFGPYVVYDVDASEGGQFGNIPHIVYTSGTGLTTDDLLDDVDPTSNFYWRYNSVSTLRCIKELK